MIQEEHKAASAAGRAGSPTGKRAAPMYVDWEYYKIFYYVAKYQNFTRAARVLGNNQPNITHAMNLSLIHIYEPTRPY